VQTGRVRTRWTAAVLLLCLLTACAREPVTPETEDVPASASTTDGRTEGPTNEPSPSTRPTGAGTTVVAAGSDFGRILFDGRGQAIYLFDVEATSKPRCYDACADAWPPVLTDGDPLAGDGVEASLLGTTRRNDGTTQVTYGGHPLYFYAHEGRHEVRCHDVFLNGGNWYAVQPDGDRAP
jgi:predicted lipoprotein with Yx(FWY)xxD motif